MSDVRSLPDPILRLYLGAYGVWGAALLVSYVLHRLGLALTFCLPLALFVGVLTAWWARTIIRRHEAGDLARAEVDDGVRSVGHILAVGSLTPAIVFLAQDPLEPTTWATCGSVAVVAAVAYGLTSAAVRIRNVVGNTAALTIAWAALPLNCTGAISVWAWLGLTFR